MMKIQLVSVATETEKKKADIVLFNLLDLLYHLCFPESRSTRKHEKSVVQEDLLLCEFKVHLKNLRCSSKDGETKTHKPSF